RQVRKEVASISSSADKETLLTNGTNSRKRTISKSSEECIPTNGSASREEVIVPQPNLQDGRISGQEPQISPKEVNSALVSSSADFLGNIKRRRVLEQESSEEDETS